ncbi:MAG: hypothetical protein QOJ11_4603 [Frankiales bacterium]|nr:hypothetical protein [Frankiales bacterium]
MTGIKSPRPLTFVAAAALASVTVAGLPFAAGTALAANGTTVSLEAPSSITYSEAAVLTGRLVKRGVGLGRRTVLVQGRPRGTAGWKAVASVRTTANGAFRVAVHPARNMEYRTYLPATATSGRAVSAVRPVGVHALVRATLDTSSVQQNGVFHLRITVSPAQPGRAVSWQQVAEAGWVHGGSATLDAQSSAVFNLTSSGTGSIQLRGVDPASGRQLAGASSAVTITITSATRTAPPAPPASPSLPGGPPSLPGGSSGH